MLLATASSYTLHRVSSTASNTQRGDRRLGSAALNGRQQQRGEFGSSLKVISGKVVAGAAVLTAGLALAEARRQRRVSRSRQLSAVCMHDAMPGGAATTTTTSSIPLLAGVGELTGKYKYFTLDQYGVMHDGRNAYAGAAECLEKMNAAGCKAVILSNYAGRSATQRQRLYGIGLEPAHLLGVVTSGELAYQHLAKNTDQLGRKVLWISWADRDNRGLGDFFDGLDRYDLATSVEEADFILASGVESMFAGTENEVQTTFEKDGDVTPFLEVLRVAAARKLLMICSNPDVRVRRPGGWLAYLTGALALEYEKLGGPVMNIGKPYGAVFQEAHRMLAEAAADAGEADLPGESICHVGDSLHHDIAGATEAGMHSAFVMQPGVHAEALGDKAGADDVLRLCQEEGTPSPNAILPRFVW